jgi:sugar-specific transcriptional regulator TrmB
MNYQHLIPKLNSYWLSTKESTIYLTCLELWSSVAGTIARKSWENRATVYSILKSLTQQQLISQVTRKWVMYFSAVSPEILANRLEQKSQEFQSVLPDLLSLTDKGSFKPKIQYFEWIEWIKQMYETILTYPWQTMYSFFNLVGAAPEVVKRVNESFIPMRINKNITAHAITNNINNLNVYNNLWEQFNVTKYMQCKVIPIDSFTIDNQINLIGGDRVLIYNFKPDELNGIIIHSKSYYQTMYSLFQYIRNQN